MEIALPCPQCEVPQTQKMEAFESRKCTSCQAELFPHATDRFEQDLTLNQCPGCGAGHLYRQKDFNRKLGVAILLIGIIGAFYTYGISLLIVTFIDICLYRYVGEVGCCYQCHGQFRDSEKIAELHPFDLELHDYFRNLKAKK